MASSCLSCLSFCVLGASCFRPGGSTSAQDSWRRLQSVMSVSICHPVRQDNGGSSSMRKRRKRKRVYLLEPASDKHNDRRVFCVPCQMMTQQPQQGLSFWSFFPSQSFVYSSNLADVDTAQLSDLWAKTLKVKRNPQDIAKALKFSYAFIVVVEQGKDFLSASGPEKKLVGFGRAVSDGAFIATICDVAVDPSYQRRGIGLKIVKDLVKTMKRRDGPTGFAVFPPPRARLFFWTIGFRPDKQFRFMRYRGRLIDEALMTSGGGGGGLPF